ncbi:putative efflux protein, MATE family [Pseudidiomarina woesei]|uniref:Putative efflux protein, MATE family n=2 Tax=Pseudidiomarina woesei TaxID=1381080 RepID=A0A0K6HBV0_9GAMM|nr:putative efflux protein, MATE family [Pseudidiomarina woesei]
MIISNIAAPLLGLIDTAIIGHLPQSIYLSAVALGAMTVSFIFLLAIFLRMTTTAEIAAAFGANDHSAQQRVVLHGIAIALGLGFLLWLLSPVLIEFAWWLIEPGIELGQLASSYVSIRLFAAPAALINLLVLGVLLGRQQSQRAMALVIFTNAVNVVADVILILGLDLNVKGAAWASVLAEVSTALVGIWLIRDTLTGVKQWQFDLAYFKRFSQMNRDVFIRSLLLQLCMATMTGYAARFGAVVVAANAVLMQFLMLISLGLDGIAYAVEALLGAARGRGDTPKIRYWMKLTLFWSLIFSVAYCLVFLLAGEFIIRLLTDLPDVINTALVYLPWLVVLPLVGHWSYYFDGVYIGLGLTQAMRDTMAVSALGIFMPSVFIGQWLIDKENANHGLWLALSLFLLARGISQWLYLKKHSLTLLVLNHPSK